MAATKTLIERAAIDWAPVTMREPFRLLASPESIMVPTWVLPRVPFTGPAVGVCVGVGVSVVVDVGVSVEVGGVGVGVAVDVGVGVNVGGAPAFWIVNGTPDVV